MSFAAVQHVATSVNNNSNLLNKRKRFSGAISSALNKTKNQTNFVSDTPNEIQNPLVQLQIEHKRKQLQTNVATVLYSVVLVMFFYLLLS
ncbi:hypothetical protein FJ651_02010 [Paucihalobacter ruber]|uniref:Uncharacterized protein n=1 Tax=Paucihalobacter ruber TaxID=2567861 RepID=A0A506PU07_9FLAO|nr:hypothetical protein [Paucihalobacter ruber]TPV35710.1 hypothetical protein FJ651_02010 [Paucihalobacter ruber]